MRATESYGAVCGDRGRRQAGSIVFLTAGAFVVLLLIGALAVDTGRIAHGRRALQLQADAAALAAARDVGGCAWEPKNPGPAAQTYAGANGFVGDLSAPPSGVALGRIETSDGLRSFVETGDLASATAVEVTAWSSLPVSLLASRYLPGALDLRASGAARAMAIAGIRAGSFLARAELDPSDAAVADGVLTSQLGGPVTLSVLDFSSLAVAQVRLGDLVDGFANVGSVDELLASEIEVGEFLAVTAEVLAAQGEDDVAASLNEVAIASASARTVRPGDFLVVSTEEEPALDATLNAYDLLAMSAQAANGQNAVLVDPLVVAIPGVGEARLTLTVVEPAQMVIGPPGMNEDGAWRTQVHTAQVRGQLDLDLLEHAPVLSGPPLQVSLFFEAAPATATLRAVQCASAADRVPRVGITAQSGVFRFGVGRFTQPLASGNTERTPVVALSALGVTLARVFAFSEQSLLGSVADLTFEGPFPPAGPALPGHTQTVATDLPAVGEAMAQSAASDVVATAELAGSLPLGLTAAEIEGLVTDLLEPVLAASGPLLTSVLASSGAHAGGADVSVFSLIARAPRLVR